MPDLSVRQRFRLALIWMEAIVGSNIPKEAKKKWVDGACEGLGIDPELLRVQWLIFGENEGPKT